jgi:hypothetical protein
VARDRGIVEAADRQIAGHRQAALAGRAAGARGHVVVGREDGGGPLAPIAQPVGAGQPDSYENAPSNTSAGS